MPDRPAIRERLGALERTVSAMYAIATSVRLAESEAELKEIEESEGQQLGEHMTDFREESRAYGLRVCPDIFS